MHIIRSRKRDNCSPSLFGLQSVTSSGLKVCGQGEWHSQKHGEKTCKRWKKLHIGVDAQGRIVASTLTESHEQDPSQVPALLSQVEYRIDRFVGDGIFVSDHRGSNSQAIDFAGVDIYPIFMVKIENS